MSPAAEQLSIHQLDPADQTGPLAGEQILLIHGFASNPRLNWQATGWVKDLLAASASLHLLTLPYHQAANPSPLGSLVYQCRPPLEEGLIPALGQAILPYLENLPKPVHLLGYSLGARICWQLASQQPQLAQSLTAGALPTENHFQPLHQGLLTLAAHPSSDPKALLGPFAPLLAASPLPLADLTRFTSFPASPLELAPLPSCPTLLFRGSEDTIAHGARGAYQLLAEKPASWLEQEGRDHLNILTSRFIKQKVYRFIEASSQG